MNIAFDATAILAGMSKNRGIGNYTYDQFKTMIEMDSENTYYFFNLFEEFYMKDKVKNGHVIDFYLFSGKSQELISDEEYKDIFGDIVKNFLAKYRIDVFYITSPFDSDAVHYQREWFDGVRTVATVYDIIPFVMKDTYLKNKAMYRFYMECVDMLRWVDEYLVISQSVKDDMMSYLRFPEDKIHVIYGAADSQIFRQICMSEQEKKELYEKFHIKGSYVICTGGDDDRKNLEGLIRAYARMEAKLMKQYQLVIVCKLSPQSVEKYTCITRELKIEERVILTNFVSTEDLIRLYNQAVLMAFPSLYEGFGLPIMEAWLCGTPVLTSKNSSLGEIAGEAAILVDAGSIASIADGLQLALAETDLEELAQKGKMRAEAFSWESTAEAALKVIHDLGKGNRCYKKESKINKIAMFTPLPPIQSGISDYSVDLLSQLENVFDIDVYIDQYSADYEEKENVHIYSAKKFPRRYKMYDRIIYQVGNSLYHEYMFPYIKKYPGIVVLHDYNLRSVLEAVYLFKTKKTGKFIENFMEDYDQEEKDTYMRQLNTPYNLSYEVNGFVTNYAQKIIVHSVFAKRKLLEKDISRNISYIPHYAVIERKPEIGKIRKELKIEEKCFLFASFGHIHETKRILPILDAFGRICMEISSINVKLYLIGKMDEELKDRFYTKVRELNISDRVFVSGYLPLDSFLKYIDAADVCLNLRYPYNGESSGTLMRSLAKGKCVIVNRIGSFGEVPENACVMIDDAAEMSESEEIGQIYKAMRRTMAAPFRKGVQNEAIKYAKSNLDLEKIGLQYVKVIKEENKKECGLKEIKIRSFAEKYLYAYTTEQINNLAKTLAFSVEGKEG